MLNTIFKGVFDTQSASTISLTNFLLCLIISLLIGLLNAGIYTYKNRYTKSFLVTLALLPAVVCVVIMMVNGNIGTGVAVAGTFSLVRYCRHGVSGLCSVGCPDIRRSHIAV